MTATAFDQLRTRVLDLIAAHDLDVDHRGARSSVRSWKRRPNGSGELMRGSFQGLYPFANPPDVVGRLVQELTGIGAQLDQLVADPRVEEIYGVDGEITVRMAGGETVCSENPAQPEAVLAVLQRLIANAGDNIDASHPKVDGIRVLLPSGRRPVFRPRSRLVSMALFHLA